MLRGRGETVVVGLSGGADSVALLHVLKALDIGQNLNAVYIDHGLRPAETPAEIAFCAGLCKSLDVPFMSKEIPPSPKIMSNAQDTLRDLRYEKDENIAYEQKAGRIALGHNKDDQAETVVLNFIRGSALTGLGGIPPCRGKIIRPLIEATRLEIEQYLESIGVNFITDPSNLKQTYTRNKVRLSLLPTLKAYNPNIVDTLCANAGILRDENTYMERQAIKKTMTLISRKAESKVELFLSPLQTLDKAIVRRVIRAAVSSVESLKGIGAAHIDDIITLVNNASSGASIRLPKGIRVIKGYSILTITTQQPVQINTYELDVPGEVVIKEAGLVIKASLVDTAQDTGNRQNIYLDGGMLNLPLTVRARQNGDFFYPLGFGRRKKVQDFFVDEKVPKDGRNGVPLVFSGSGLVWIAGMRGDERFKPKADTRTFVRLELLQMRT